MSTQLSMQTLQLSSNQEAYTGLPDFSLREKTDL